MKLEELRQVGLFQASRYTILVYEPAREAWVVSAYDGTEALVPEQDLLEFINHCHDSAEVLANLEGEG